MSKKKSRKKSKNSGSPPKFSVGDRVRVKPGVQDSDYPDIPIGGCAGVVEEVDPEAPIRYLVRWSEETLDQLHPVFKNRCERDSLDYDRMGLDEGDLEPDTGGPAEVEQPEQIVTRPLDMKSQDDRIRAVFELTGDDLLPDVDSETLNTYWDYLVAKLVFPFEAEWEQEVGLFSTKRTRVLVTSLSDADEDFPLDESYGLICTIEADGQRGDAPLSEIEVWSKGRNRQLVNDYRYWFCNWG